MAMLFETQERLYENMWQSNTAKKAHPATLKPRSAFVKVHFCISEHTNPSACSNILSLSFSHAAHDNSLPAALFDLQCFP